MKRVILASLVAFSFCAPAYAVTAETLQKAINVVRDMSAKGVVTPAAEDVAIKGFIEAYWETHPRTWSSWFFNDLPPGVTIPSLLGTVTTPAPFTLRYGIFGDSPSDFLGNIPLSEYGLSSVRYYIYNENINTEVLYQESFDVANNFRTSFSSLNGFEPVIHAVPFDNLGNRITVLDGDGYNRADAFALVLSIPEPETYAMLLAGLGLMSVVVRRKQK